MTPNFSKSSEEYIDTPPYLNLSILYTTELGVYKRYIYSYAVLQAPCISLHTPIIYYGPILVYILPFYRTFTLPPTFFNINDTRAAGNDSNS